MMNSLTTLNPPLPAVADFGPALSILALVADPAAAKARLDDLMTATSQARDLIDQAKAGQAALKTAADDQARTLADERAAHRAELDAQTGQFNQMVANLQAGLTAREAAVSAAEGRLADDRKKFDVDRAALDAKLDAIRRAAA
jgi:hypothetical protein